MARVLLDAFVVAKLEFGVSFVSAGIEDLSGSLEGSVNGGDRNATSDDFGCEMVVMTDDCDMANGFCGVGVSGDMLGDG